MTGARGRLLVDGVLVPGRVAAEGGRIARVELEPAGLLGAGAPIVAPGLVDLHVHGFGGFDPLGDLAGMARALARAGTTSFLPTLYPAPVESLARAAARVAASAARLAPGEGARVLGVHVEGPFVNPGAAGALPRAALRDPDPAALRALFGPPTGDGRAIARMTLAPELPGAADLVGELRRSGCVPSFGHSLATSADARRAAAGGPCAVTHLYNAMRAFHHRDAGLVGFALAGGADAVELIGDLAHVGSDAMRIALEARGTGAIALVSDALAVAHAGVGSFEREGRAYRVREGAVWWRDERGAERLAGSASSQLDGIRRAVAAGVATPEEALSMASASAARAAGREAELGRLAVGARADWIELRSADLALERVVVEGRPLAVPSSGGA